MVRWIIFNLAPATGSCPKRDCWWEATLKLSLTSDLHLKDTTVREGSFSISTANTLLQKQNFVFNLKGNSTEVQLGSYSGRFSPW